VWHNPKIPYYLQKRLLHLVKSYDVTAEATTRNATAQAAIDGSQTTYWVSKGSGAELILTLKRPALLTEVRIYSGCLRNHGNPSGVCTLKSYKLQYHDGSNWRNLIAPVKDAPNYCGQKAEAYRFCHAFTPQKVKKIKLIIDSTYDTLRRNNGVVPASGMTGIVREVELVKAFGGK
jgi:hypothetical protein